MNIPLDYITRITLGMGYKFIFQPRPSVRTLRQHCHKDFNDFYRRLVLSLYFCNEESFDSKMIPRIRNNTWIPSPTELLHKLPFIGQSLLDYKTRSLQAIADLPIDSLKIRRDPVHDLLRTTAIQLSRNDQFVIKQADKNLGLTILPRDYYDSLCWEHLEDTATYKRLYYSEHLAVPRQCFARLRAILNKYGRLFLAKSSAEGHQPLTKLARSLLQREEEAPTKLLGKFYCLPKMHKTPLKGRPIVSSINSVTYFASLYLHNRLLPIVQSSSLCPNICSSSLQVFDKLTELNKHLSSVHELHILCADVTSLYPSIPIDSGLSLVKLFLENCGYFTDHNDIMFLHDLLKWVLTNNYFHFQTAVYLQINGTAMGTPVAVCYANIVLQVHDKEIRSALQPVCYLRYIDDLFIVAPRSKDRVLLQTTFHNAGPLPGSPLKLEAITEGTEGIFLDLCIKLMPTNDAAPIALSLYTKPMNKFLYIPFLSNHPKHILKNFIINEVNRITRLNGDINAFFSRLYKRGYPHEFITSTFSDTLQHYPYNIAPQRKLAPIIILDSVLYTSCSPLLNFINIPEVIKESREYQTCFTSTDVIIGRRLARSLGSYFLHPISYAINEQDYHILTFSSPPRAYAHLRIYSDLGPYYYANLHLYQPTLPTIYEAASPDD